MAARKAHVSETPATEWLRTHCVAFTGHPYEYLEHGGARHSAAALGLDPFTVVETLVMLVGIDPRVCTTLLGAQPVQCALAE